MRYGARWALEGVTAEAARGCLVCLVGLNGAGKSTLLKAVIGAVHATGTISVLGVSDAGRRTKVAYLPQREDVNWAFPISVLEVVMLGRQSTLRRIGPDSPAERAAALEALRQVDMADLRGRPIGELSGGQQQRVVLARALYSRAQVMLLDEPLAGVDPATREAILALLREYCANGGTVLMATHDVVESAAIADRVWGINRSVVCDVPGNRLLEEPVLRSIYGAHLILLPSGRMALGDQAR